MGTSYRRALGDARQPPAASRQPPSRQRISKVGIFNFPRLPPANRQSHVGFRFPVSGFWFTVSSFQFPVSNFQFPFFIFKPEF